MTYNSLCYDSIKFDGVTFSFGPNFICPRCKTRFEDHKTTTTLTSIVKNNQKQVFRCHKCGSTVELYVAVTRTEKGEQGIQISVNPIDPDWLEKEIVEKTEIRG